VKRSFDELAQLRSELYEHTMVVERVDKLLATFTDPAEDSRRAPVVRETFEKDKLTIMMSGTSFQVPTHDLVHILVYMREEARLRARLVLQQFEEAGVTP